jgi:hypothetical protein
MSVEAYVFITTTNPGPRKLFGIPDVAAIVTGDDLAGMDAVIDRIVELPEVIGTDSKVVRWIEGELKADPDLTRVPTSVVEPSR